MRDVLPRVGEDGLQQDAARVLRAQRRQVVDAAEERDPTVVRRVVRRHLARRKVARPSSRRHDPVYRSRRR